MKKLVFAVLGFPFLATAQSLPETTPESSLRQTLDDARPRFHKCYVDHVPAAARVHHGDNARLNIRVLENGRVDSAYFVDTTLQAETARTCVLDVARTLDFRTHTQKPLTINVWLGLDSSLPAFVVRLADPPALRVSTADLLAIVQKDQARFTACYEAALSRKPTLSGKIVVQVAIGRTGRADEIIVLENTIEDTEFAPCMSEQFKALSFPAPGDDAPVLLKVPFTFETN